jgi:hypothetical protein
MHDNSGGKSTKKSWNMQIEKEKNAKYFSFFAKNLHNWSKSSIFGRRLDSVNSPEATFAQFSELQLNCPK